MSFLNFGKKDRYGKQRRIEHRGKNLRISRTGGAALRTQAKVAGLNVTANTRHGLRISSRVAKNTQIALQNGRPVLRGRYGSGATRMNLSKSGVSVSTRNALGTFNWVKPNRSSVKIAGIQLRGKKAANIQLVYLLLAGAAMVLLVGWQVLSFLLRILGRLFSTALHLIASTPYLLDSARQRLRNTRIKTRLKHSKQLFEPPLSNWTASDLQNALLLVFNGWGRGLTAQQAAEKIIQRHQQHKATTPTLQTNSHELNNIAQRLEHIRNQATPPAITSPEVITALLAQQHQTLTQEQTVDSFLNADDWAVALGGRTVLQEQLLQIFADFAQLRFEVAEAEQRETNLNTEQGVSAALQQPFSQPVQPHQKPTQTVVNLNTASHAQLQTLPHIGFERALDIMAMRPITDVGQLTDIHGIGPARLADIQRAGVEL